MMTGLEKAVMVETPRRTMTRVTNGQKKAGNSSSCNASEARPFVMLIATFFRIRVPTCKPTFLKHSVAAWSLTGGGEQMRSFVHESRDRVLFKSQPEGAHSCNRF